MRHFTLMWQKPEFGRLLDAAWPTDEGRGLLVSNDHGLIAANPCEALVTIRRIAVS